MECTICQLRLLIKTIFLLIWVSLSFAQDTLDVPEVSHERGFYDEPIYLTINSDVEGASIVFTLDGSDPTDSPNATTQSAPVTLYIDCYDLTGRFTSPTVILRAISSLTGSQPSSVITHSYLFLDEIEDVSPHEESPGPNWPDRNMSNGNSQYMDYGLDPDVLNDPRYTDQILGAFTSIPSISLVTNLENLFGADSGIYFNALRHGREWERPASVELLNPDGSPGFQVDAGVRIRGGWGRRNENPKHAFRLFFRSEYGYSKLEFPLFGDAGVDKFDKVDLRTSQNYSWAAEGSRRNTLVREVISRDIQRDMGQPHTRSRYYNLFLNGVYWGIYQTQERAEAAYAKSYFGGEREDYDVVKVDVGENLNLYEIEATDGTLDAYNRLWEMATEGFDNDSIYYSAQGLNVDGTINPDYEKLIDVDNLIDYLICTYYVCDGDGPLNGNQMPNNFYAIYNRTNPDGFKYFRHDAEHSLLNPNGDLTGPVTGGEEFRHFNPRWLQQRLTVHPEYRMRFADRVYKHLHNNGACTGDVSINRVVDRKNQIEQAIIAQSARWGDSRSDVARTKHDDWLPAVNYMTDEFFSGRTVFMRAVFRSRGWYPTFEPPVFNQEDGVVSAGTNISITASQGIIYYTIDGNDPRQLELVDSVGSISASAVEYTEALEINHTTQIKTRALNNGQWSALNEISLVVPNDLDYLKITEIHYHPLDGEDVNDTELEFIELKNFGNVPMNLGFMTFAQGIEYSFPGGTELGQENYIVLASNLEAFENRYGYEAFGEYEGQLSNGGETISLLNASGDTLISLNYDDNYPWPNSADGSGYSMVLRDESLIACADDAESWHASAHIHGTPGISDPTAVVEEDIRPSTFHVSQNYPNPFNQSTWISYHLDTVEDIEVEIFNLRGQRVRSIRRESNPQGWNRLEINAPGLASGIYIYRVSSGEFNATRKMILLK